MIKWDYPRHSALYIESSTTELPRQLSWLGPNLTSATGGGRGYETTKDTKWEAVPMSKLGKMMHLLQAL